MRFDENTLEQARDLMLDVIDVLNEAKVNYMVDYGTLLGLIRSGDLIPWDSDVDFAIPSTELSRLLATLPTFRRHNRYISKRYFNRDHESWTARDYRVIKVRTKRWRLLKGKIAADLGIKYRCDDGFYYWSTLGMVCRAEHRFFDSHEEIEYRGRMIKVPAHCEEYLEMLYGNWREPDQHFDFLKEDRTIVDPM